MDLIAKIYEHEADYLNLLKRMVEIETPTSEKAEVDKLVDVVEDYLKNVGCMVHRLIEPIQGDHLVAEYGEGEDRILYIGHIDTVWDLGTLDKFPFEIKENRLSGPGTFDMKCGVMQAMYAIKLMQENDIKPKNKIVLLINSDEEIGSPSSRKLIEEEAMKSKYVIVGEGAMLPNGKLKVERKGFGMFTLEIHGKSSHAGVDPENGVSAIHELAKQIQVLESFEDSEKGITVNVGVVNGGSRANVVADYLRAEIDIRAWTRDGLEEVESKIKNLESIMDGIKLTVSGGINRLPMEFDEKGKDLFAKTKVLANEQGFELEGGRVGGMSDANLTAALGIPTIDGLGAVGGGGHSLDEHILIDYIPERIALLMRMFERL